jgi:hypothetical protein
MAVDTERQAHVVGPASWFGPSDFDLAVGETFGMPERFKEAYHHYCPPLEAHKERSMLYRLYVLLNHLNQPASYQYSSNVGREPLSVVAPTHACISRACISPPSTLQHLTHECLIDFSFHYDPTDNFLGSKTLTSFRTTSVTSPPVPLLLSARQCAYLVMPDRESKVSSRQCILRGDGMCHLYSVPGCKPCPPPRPDLHLVKCASCLCDAQCF